MPPADDAKPVLRLAALGLAALVALCAFAAISYTSALRWVEHTIEVRAELDDWLIALLEAQSRARGYAISADPSYLEPYADAVRRARASTDRLRRLTAESPEQLSHLAEAERNADAAIAATAELVATVEAGTSRDEPAKLTSLESRRRVDAFREHWQRIRDQEEKLLSDRKSTARGRALLMIAGASVLALASIGLLAFAWQIQRKRTEELDSLAREARARLRTISDVAAALSKARTRVDVIEVVLEQGMRVVDADTCTLYLLDEAGETLELVGERGAPPEVVARIQKLSATTGHPDAFAAFRAGTSLWVESAAHYHDLYPQLAQIEAEGPRAQAFWSVPLIVEGRPAGLLSMGYFEERTFSADDRALVETLAKQCGEGLMRAARHDGEARARRWFTTTLRSIGDAVIATDAQGHVTFMNPIAEELTGWSASEARGKPLEEVFVIHSEATRARVESPVDKVLREGAVVGLPTRTLLRSRNGRELPIDDSGAPIRSESGELFGVVLVFRDVSRERAERGRREFLTKAGEALVGSLDYEVTLSTVARLAVPVIADWCSIDVIEPGESGLRRAAIEHADAGKRRLAAELNRRYPPDPNARSGAPEVARSGKSELHPEISEALLEAGARDAEHLKLLRELHLRSAMVVPLKARGHTLGAITFIHAESGRRYGEEDLAFAEEFARRAAMAIENSLVLKQIEQARSRERQLRDEAEVASRAKDEFLAMVSHELRTPLNAILGWTVILRRRAPSPETDRALSIIERNALTQAKLIEDVLDISRIISGKLALTLGPTNVADAVTAAIETVTPAAQAKSIELVVDRVEQGLTITADADRVQQVVWNLLSNAVKFTPKGGQVTVRAFREGSEVVISVGDSGEGIVHGALPFVFEAFHQADASTTRRHGGLGLGLAIVKQLVSAHGGTVQAFSEGLGKGATFEVRLPALSAIPALRRGRRVGSSSDPSAAPPPSRLEGLRVLVIDDEVDSLELVSQVLREQGAEVHAATSARAALETFTEVRPDVLVSDIGMPGEDGYSLIRKIRAMPAERGGSTPAVALTAYAREEDAQRAFNAGYQMHLTKPVEPDRLASTVSSLGGRTLGPA